MNAYDEPEQLLKLEEVKRRVGLGKSMIYKLIQERKFPAPYKISPSASRWSDQEIAAWIDNLKTRCEGKKPKA
jgi:prophage regulatory protein